MSDQRTAPQGETVEEAARNAAKRWRYIAIGLALVGFTNLVNVAITAAGVRGQSAAQSPLCVTFVGVPLLSEKPSQQAFERRQP